MAAKAVKVAKAAKVAKVAKPKLIVVETAPVEETAPVVERPAREPGIIDSLVELLRGEGGTREELYTALATRFPKRATTHKGMRITVSVQLSALKTKKGLNVVAEKIEGRGTVYKIV